MRHKATEYLTEAIKLIRDSTAYSLRYSSTSFNLALQKPRSENLKRSFTYRGAKLQNSPPNAIKAEQS